MRTAFIEALFELARKRPDIFLVCGDLGFGVLDEFARTLPGQFLNAGVAEQNMTGVAAGLALSGKTVFTYSIANFPTFRCLEQIRNDVCYHHANVKVVAVGGGFCYGSHGYTHHGIEDLAVMRSLPGMTVVAPGDPVEARLATRAIAEHEGPCYLRLGRAGEPVVHLTTPAFELGKALRLRDGGDVTLIATGGMLKFTVDVADKLRDEGIDPRVLSMPTVKPIDEEAIIDAARVTHGIITLEEHSVTGGLGDAVADVLARRLESPVPFVKLGHPDEVDHRIGNQAYMGDFASQLPVIVRRMFEDKD